MAITSSSLTTVLAMGVVHQRARFSSLKRDRSRIKIYVKTKKYTEANKILTEVWSNTENLVQVDSQNQSSAALKNELRDLKNKIQLSQQSYGE